MKAKTNRLAPKKSSSSARGARIATPLPAAKSAGPKPAAAKRGSVRVFQIFYEDSHKKALDPAFEPYDNRASQSELLEFAVFENLAQSAKVAGARYWGALSWRFLEKTGMSGKTWLAAMAANPGFDVYYCNPHPVIEALYHNVWIQGEPAHPSFMLLARAFFEAAGLPVDRLTTIQPASTFAAANYFVATPAFWEAYLRFVRRAIGNAERKMPARMRALLHSKLADPEGYYFGATYVPFIVERLFAVFLATDGAAFKAYKVPLPAREQELNVHLRLLREMKDVAHKTKSIWMVSCWINYRNLYLAQMHGREWCEKYLSSVTPTDIKFA